MGLLGTAEAVASPSSRLVAVRFGCIELPNEYQAVACPNCVGCGGGTFQGESSEPIYWFWWGEEPWWFRVYEPARVIWKRPSIKDWHIMWCALVDQKGERQYWVTYRGLWLHAKAQRPEVLDRLLALASAYRPEQEASSCEVSRCASP